MRGSDDAPRAGRLTKRREFVAAASGRRFHSGRMTVQGLLREDEGPLRIGYTVTKKVGHAVERNRIKRRLRHATRDALARHDVAPSDGSTGPLPPHPLPSADVVIVARRPALEAAYSSLIDDFLRALHVVSRPGGGRSDAGKRRGAASPNASSRAPSTVPSAPIS